MKKLLSLILALTLSLNFALPALADDPVEAVQPTTDAQTLSQGIVTEPNDDEDVTEVQAISIIIYDLEETTGPETPINPVSAGVTPDSPLYFLDKLIESIQLALTKTPEAKAALLTAISQERLAEIEALDSDKLDQYLDKLLTEVTTALQKAADAITDAQQKGVEITKLMETLEQAAVLGSSVELPQAISKTEVLEDAKNKLQETTRAVKVQAAVVRGIDEEIVVALRSQGLGYGQIALLNKLATTITLDGEESNGMDQVMAVFASNKSIGQTMKAFNTNPGRAKKQAAAQKPIQASGEDDDQEHEEAVESANVTKTPGNSGKAKGNTPTKGKGK